MNSLRAKLGLGLVISVVVMTALLWLVNGASVRRLMQEQVVSRLAHDGENLLGGLTLGADGRPTLPAERIQGIYHRPFSGHYFLIEVEGRVLRSRSLWDETLPLAPLAVGERRLDYISGPQQQPLLLWSGAFRKQGRVIRLAVAEDLASLEEGTRRIQMRLLGWSLATMMVLLLIQGYIVARALRPVADAAADVARLEQGEIRELREPVPEEVQPLVHAINMLLQRQRQRLLRSREALGNLAHAIKTPLTLLLQLAGDKVPADDPLGRRQLAQYGRQISALVDQALRRARLAGDSLGASHFDLQQDLPALVDTVRRLHRDKPLGLHTDVGGLKTLPLEQHDGMELLGNLLDNACKWARTRVDLRVVGGAQVQIVVEDDGPGVDAAALERLAGRGVRHDEDAPGHGMGLSIVKSLLDELGATIGFSRSARLGGLEVRVRLAPQGVCAASPKPPQL